MSISSVLASNFSIVKVLFSGGDTYNLRAYYRLCSLLPDVRIITEKMSIRLD